MIALILSIASSSLIFVIFKLFRKFDIDTFQAIVFNYFTAFFIGMGLYGGEWRPEFLESTDWMLAAVICGLLFISLFFIMGSSSQLNGVATTSVAVKMSMAASLIGMIVIFHTPLNSWNGTGILLAILGVFLVSYSKAEKASARWMLAVLFLGSGFLDLTIYFVQKFVLDGMPGSIFSAFGLGIAGLFGSVILAYQLATGQRKFALKNVIAGLILGIPNYFSIYLLILSYQITGWKEITVLSITNVSVVIISALLGFLAFREKATPRKLIGLISAIFAIILLYLSNDA